MKNKMWFLLQSNSNLNLIDTAFLTVSNYACLFI